MVPFALSLLTLQAPSREQADRNRGCEYDAHKDSSLFRRLNAALAVSAPGSIPPDKIASIVVHAATFCRSCAGSILSSVSSGVWW